MHKNFYFVNPCAPKGGGVSEYLSPPQKKWFSCNNFSKKRYRNDILANYQWINDKSVDFYKIEHCPYMREGEGSILETSELKKSLKIDIFFITQHIKELVSRKFSGLYIKCGNRIKFFSKQRGKEQCLGFTLRNFVKMIQKVLLVSRPLPIFPERIIQI